MITIVLPTSNEAAIIRANLERLLAFLHSPNVSFRAGREISHRDNQWRIIIADNGSTDNTRAIVREIATHEPRIELLEIPEAGKGGAVLAAWQRAMRESRIMNHESWDRTQCVFAFMDADLATDLTALPKLASAIRSGADIAVGSRYLPGAQTERGFL